MSTSACLGGLSALEVKRLDVFNDVPAESKLCRRQLIEVPTGFGAFFGERASFAGRDVRIKDLGRIYPKRPVHFAFGEPMTVTGNGREQQARIVKFIEDKLQVWKKEEVRPSKA